MRNDYHMHFEKGAYDEEWVEGFFRAAVTQNLDEIGISEHSHTFPEFYDLYRDTLILDDSPVGQFQRQWLKTNKFKYTVDEYFCSVRVAFCRLSQCECRAGTNKDSRAIFRIVFINAACGLDHFHDAAGNKNPASILDGQVVRLSATSHLVI